MADLALVTSQGLDQFFMTTGYDASGAVMVCQQPPEHLLLPTFKGLWQRMRNFSVTTVVSKT
jgi:hypothetical protein